MGAGGWVTPRRTEIVQESERTRVTRLFYPEQTLIRKEPLGPDAERRLEHETAILAGLRGAAGLAQLADAPCYPGSVLLVDAGRVSLAGSPKPLAADDLSWLAPRLARALANLHDREVIHRDITPSNVVLSDDGGEPCLVGFTLATSFAQARRASARMGRTVDQRADLYGLGATLYELAAGEPPFGHRPAARLRHDRLARVPAALSAIIIRLLEPDADDRHQSADGVANDLERLRDPGAGRPAGAARARQQDIPVRLPPPRPAAEDATPEVAEPRAAFAAALAGQCGAILAASHALSSETSVERLRARVTEVLAALENRLIGGALTAARLETVELIADQLAVSLGNAQLFAENRRIADEQAALRRVATLVARGARPREVFTAVAEETGRLLKADFSVLIRYDSPTRTLEIAGSWLRAGAEPPPPVGGRLPLGGYNVSSLVYETGRPARIDYEREDIGDIGGIGADAASRWGFRSSVGAPVIIKSRPWGALVVARRRQHVLPADTEARLAAFNELVGTAIANAEASAEVAASRARVIAAADQARRRIERDLHDGAQQRLVSLALQLRQAQAAVPPGLADLAAELGRAVTAANSALDEVGEIARGVHPAVLTSGGLRPAVRALAHRSPVPTRLQECTDRRLPEHVEVTAYYVIAEALTNATKHARAAAVGIRAELAGAAGEVLVVTIRDDGVGGADPARGTGLTGLKDRVEALGGIMRIESPTGAGTMLRAELPLTPDGRVVRDDRYAQ